MKKILLINLIVMVCLAGFFEAVSRVYDHREMAGLAPVPENAEGFGDFQGFMRYYQKSSRVEAQTTGGDINIYEPYTGTLLRPDYGFRVQNINCRINSLGLRSSEPAVPKPANTVRICILGGSTVQGGFNDRWIIATYLDRELKKYDPGVEVINAGIMGFTSQEELALLQTRIMDLEPDVVVVLDGRNDLYYSIFATWKPRRGDPYVYCKRALDGLINYPTFISLSTNLARFLTRKSSALTRAFRYCFRQKPGAVYPPAVKFNDRAIAVYLDNLRQIKAALETRGIKGIIAFQPTLGCAKENLTAYEKSVASYLREEEKSDWLAQVSRVWPQVGRQVAALSASGPVRTYDLSRIFEATAQTAYIDSCHYTPLGSQLIGARIAALIRAEGGGPPDRPSPGR